MTWDVNGRHYGRGRGLAIDVDGRIVARRATLGRVIVPVARRPVLPIDRPNDRAVQLVRNRFPIPSASTGADPERLHDAIDRRVWFFPETPNGWEAPASATGGEQWFAIDLGRPVRLERSEIAFAANGNVAPPLAYRLQAWIDGGWRDIAGAAGRPVGNGITAARWNALVTSRVRLVISPAPDRAARLVELKLF